MYATIKQTNKQTDRQQQKQKQQNTAAETPVGSQVEPYYNEVTSNLEV